MPNDGATGTTFTWGAAAQTDVRSITYNEASNEVDVTVLGDSTHQYVAGIKDVECTLEVVGVSGLVIGDTGTITIAWNDGASDGLGGSKFVCTACDASGSVDSEIITSLTFKPYGA